MPASACTSDSTGRDPSIAANITPFADAFNAEATPVGNGLDEGVMLGPLQNRMQYDKVVRLVDLAPTPQVPDIEAAAAHA